MKFVKSLVLAMPLVVLVPAPSFAHYPFPSSQEEKQKASRIGQAVEAETPAAVRTLTGLLGDKNPRVQTAALLGSMRLANTPLDFTAAVAAAGVLKDSKHAFVSAAAEAATILLNRQLSLDERRAQLVKLTRSTEGRYPTMMGPRGQCREGYPIRAFCPRSPTRWQRAPIPTCASGLLGGWAALTTKAPLPC